jgi:hypothetical protein
LCCVRIWGDCLGWFLLNPRPEGADKNGSVFDYV